MGVYLPNVDMPKEGFVEILIRDDGTVQQTGQSFRIGGTDYYTPYVGEMPAMYKAVPVPPHGDLIDRNNLLMIINQIKGQAESPESFVFDAIESAIKSRRAIVPGEEETT